MRRFPREIALALVLCAIYWLMLFGLSFVMGCGSPPPPAPVKPPPSCLCVCGPTKEAIGLISTFPDTSAKWFEECGPPVESDAATILFGAPPLTHDREPPEKRWA